MLHNLVVNINKVSTHQSQLCFTWPSTLTRCFSSTAAIAPSPASGVPVGAGACWVLPSVSYKMLYIRSQTVQPWLHGDVGTVKPPHSVTWAPSFEDLFLVFSSYLHFDFYAVTYCNVSWCDGAAGKSHLHHAQGKLWNSFHQD